MMPDSRHLLRFVLTAGLLYVGWYLLYNLYILPHTGIDGILTHQIAGVSAALIRLFGVSASGESSSYALVTVDGLPSVIVGPQCDGLSLYALFAGFVVAYPGPWRQKLWFIPAGIAAIYAVNILRVVALALNHRYAYQSMEFNHHYTFTLVVYGFIFWLWTIWVRRFAEPSRPVPPAYPPVTPPSVSA